MIRIAVYIFVYFHLLATISWSLPDPPENLKIATQNASTSDKITNWSAFLLHWNRYYIKTSFISDYLRFVGAKQNWNMFAPNPITHDVWVDAEVKLQDGTIVTEVFPRPSLEPVPQRFVRERYRKFIEAAEQERHAILWPSLAVYMANRTALKDPENPPIHVKLNRHLKFVMPPGFEQPKDYDSFTFFETPIRKKDLR